jgi:uncharacterized C2H2 Zn-finger protein
MKYYCNNCGSEKLKPCPFCGNKEEYRKAYLAGVNNSIVFFKEIFGDWRPGEVK